MERSESQPMTFKNKSNPPEIDQNAYNQIAVLSTKERCSETS